MSQVGARSTEHGASGDICSPGLSPRVNIALIDSQLIKWLGGVEWRFDTGPIDIVLEAVSDFGRFKESRTSPVAYFVERAVS